MNARVKVNIEDYLSLYERGLQLNQIRPLSNQTYKILGACGLDIRIVHRKQIYSNVRAFEKIKHFVMENEYFYMIPVTTINETIVGFILRGVFNSNYSTVSREFTNNKVKVPLMFGFNKKFKQFEEHSVCYPIVVCEGSKDCLFLRQFYPYTLAVNTSSMGVNAQVLINISNKFVLAYDNDEAGQEGIYKDKKVLRELGAQVASLELDKSKDAEGNFLIKDCSDYIKYPNKIPKLKEELIYKIKRVMSF